MRIHQQKHTLAEPCFFFNVLFITNHIADALSDLSCTAVLARAEPYGSIFFREPLLCPILTPARLLPPSIGRFRVRCGGGVRIRCGVRIRQSYRDFKERGNNLAGG